MSVATESAREVSRTSATPETKLFNLIVGAVSRMVEGAAAVSVLIVPTVFSAPGPSSVAAFPVSTVTLCNAALLVGMAFGALLQQLCVGRLNRQQSWMLATLFIAVGVGGMCFTTDLRILTILRVITGLGVVGPWSAAQDLMRSSLSHAARWKGICTVNLLFPFGAFAICSGAVFISAEALLIGVTVVAVLLLPAIRSINEPQRVLTASDLPCPLKEFCTELPGGSCSDESAVDGGTECVGTEEHECCGGRRWLPTELWKGVSLSAIGHLALWGTMMGTVTAMGEPLRSVSAILVFAGMMIGIILFQSTSPRTGYAVLLLPFLLLSLIVAVAIAWVEPQSGWHRGMLFLLGVFPGAVHSGMFSLTGELFSDESNRDQTIVQFSGALIAAGILLVVRANSVVIALSHHESEFLAALVFLGGVLVIRQLPNPLLSSLGGVEEENAEIPEF